MKEGAFTKPPPIPLDLYAVASPIISVVIPTKSNLNGLKATAEALWNIDEERIELIVIDGGGCTATKEWLLDEQHRIAHMRSATDGGVYDAMNYGKECASGDWVWFAGAGDLPVQAAWQRFLETQTSEPEDEQPGIHVFGVQTSEDREGGVPAHYPARWDESMIWRNTTHHQGVLYARTLIQAHRFDASLRVLADYALHLTLWSKQEPARVQDETWAVAASGGLSRKFDVGLYAEEWRFKRKTLRGWRKAIHPFWLTGKYLSKRFS